jgi:hypothetical protein
MGTPVSSLLILLLKLEQRRKFSLFRVFFHKTPAKLSLGIGKEFK